MSCRKILKSIFVGACAAALTAGTVSADEPAPTLLAPLQVTPGLPQVGQGASLFTPDALSEIADQARLEHESARDAARACGTTVTLTGPTPEDLGQFDLGALTAGESQAQYRLQQAALTARVATQAALDARADALRDGGDQAAAIRAEAARQAAVRDFQTAQTAAQEARLRALDLLDLATARVGGNAYALRALEIGKYVAGCAYDAAGKVLPYQPGKCTNSLYYESIRQFEPQVAARTLARRQSPSGVLYVPPEFKDLRLADIHAQQRDEGGKPVVRVSGLIVNPGKHPVSVPGLWLEMLDRYGTSLKSEQIMAPRHEERIKGGEAVAFTYAAASVPDRSTRTAVTFSPMSRQTPYLLAESGCPETDGKAAKSRLRE